MIHTPLTEVLKDAGFTPENFYLHPIEATPADYHPVWHLTERKWQIERRASDPNAYKVTEVLE